MEHAPIDESLRAAFAPRFRLVSILGRGAMATVYLAHEPPRDRYVALKVLAEPYHGTLEASRFRREARVLTTLRHPNILRAFDVGSQGPFDWYSMPFIAGESLRERLDRERRLPIDEACRVAIDVLAALAHSHASEIVHRDVKPDNVLLGARRAMLADFGIARRVELPDSGEPTVATAHGVTLGTPAYMSPEQIAAERSIDGRSDVYSTAVMLYECLSGTLPITGKSARDFMARHMTEAPVPLAWVAPDVPTSIARAVQRGLAKSPGDRFDSATAFHDALIDGLHQSPRQQTSSCGVPAVTVAPLEFSGLPQDRWIAIGMWEAIVRGLRGGNVRVIDEHTRRGATDGRWHVDGRCQVSYAQVHVALSVTDRVRGLTQAIEPVEGHATNLLGLQQAVAQHIRRQLALDGFLSEPVGNADDEHSLLAEALYLRGRSVSPSVSQPDGRQALTEAASYFERAVQHAPRHVRAHEAHAGVILQLASLDHPGALEPAIAIADRALSINPAAATALYCKGIALARLGEWTAAIRCMERAVAADPERQRAHYALGRCRLMEALCTPVWEHLGRAVRPLSRAIALDPGHAASYRELAAAFLYAGDDAEAESVLHTARSIAHEALSTQPVFLAGLETLVSMLHTPRDRHDTAVLLLSVVLGTDEGGDELVGRSFPARVCCAVRLAGDRSAAPESARDYRHTALSISGANPLDLL